MWSAPFDFNLYSNWAAVGLGTETASEELYEKLYNQKKLKGFLRAPANEKPAKFEYVCYD
jgi:hypothetical protein